MSARRFAKETFQLTGGNPTTDALATLVTALRAADFASRGLLIDEGRGVTAVISVDTAKTIVSGIMRCYAGMAVDRNVDGSIPTQRWVKYPTLDVDLIGDTGIAGTTERDIPLGDKTVQSGAGRLVWLPDAVIGSAGSTLVTVTYSSSRWI
jgi:hypothetical protein